MSTEIINARSEPLEGGPPPYWQQSKRYVRSGKTDGQIKRFCEGYAIKGTITGAARYAGVDPSYHYKWLECDAEYPAEFKLAHLKASEALVEEGRRRALEGVEEPTGWYQGVPGGFVKRYSDSLLIFLIKGAFPDIYKDRHEHTGKNGGPIEVQSTVTIEQFPVWLKQAIVVVSSGVEIDPEVEKVLRDHFEQKFLEAEKRVGSGSTSGQTQPQLIDSSEPVIDFAVESVSESERKMITEPESPTEPIAEPTESRPDYRSAKRVTLDMDDI